MSEVVMIHDVKPKRLLQSVVDRKIPVVISYLSDARWHAARVLITNICQNTFSVRITPQKRTNQINIQAGQAVGISLAYGYGAGYDKFIFDTTVAEPDPSQNSLAVGQISLQLPESVELVPRRSFYRVPVPNSMDITVIFCHRYCASGAGEVIVGNGPDRQARLIDISAGGLQIAIDSRKKHDFHKGQFVSLLFTPVSYETPLKFNAQIKNILPTADGKSICFGLQMVGLEASPEGRMILSRLVGIVEQYQQINQSEKL